MSEIIRVNDVVVVNNPMLFIRCGYPYTKEDMKVELREHSNDLCVFLRKLGIACAPTDLIFGRREKIRGMKRLEDQLAFMMLHAKGFGGYERAIYEEKTSRLTVGQQYRVTEIRFCKTGDYSPGSKGGYAGGNYYDPEPAELHNVKTHKVLTLNTNTTLLNAHVQIRACHVTKIVPDTN